jgi:hypothetical protein
MTYGVKFRTKNVVFFFGWLGGAVEDLDDTFEKRVNFTIIANGLLHTRYSSDGK